MSSEFKTRHPNLAPSDYRAIIGITKYTFRFAPELSPLALVNLHATATVVEGWRHTEKKLGQGHRNESRTLSISLPKRIFERNVPLNKTNVGQRKHQTT